MKAQCLMYSSFGGLDDVLKLESSEVSDSLQSNEVLISLLASPVQPSDIGMITGKYGSLPNLPAIGGREGIGEIVEAGNDCKNFIGKRVKMPFGAWRSLSVASFDELFFVPDDIDIYQASMSFINPLTAWMILNTIRELRPGDWVMQNAANSAVGVSTIQIAKSMGIKTINLVRDAESRKEKLISYGATLVFEDETFDPKLLTNFTDWQKPVLGMNSVGGNSVMNIIKSMAFGGEIVTFGGMVGDKVRFPTRELIFNDLKLRGFWLDKWVRSQTHEKMQSMYNIVFSLIRNSVVNIPIDTTVKLSDGPKALIEAYKQQKNGKVLVVQ